MGRFAEMNLAGKSILVVDDHDPTRNLLVNFLEGLGATVANASGGLDALKQMGETRFDLVLLDLRMDDMDGLAVLKKAKSEDLASNYTMMSAEGTVPAAVEAIRLGASDFLVKPFDLNELMSVVTRVLRIQGSGDPTLDPRAQWRDKFAPGLIGEHESLLEVFLVLERIANTDCTVLVLGESGTGKELIANAIHNGSGRQKRAFVPVNCGAIPETLIESELFGHAKGAFSGATQSRDGRFAAADQGTLFLDEIGEMSLAVQVKFLRVLQEGEYVPVGETKPRSCDVRIIAATNKDLETMAGEGKFREDLFYRLNLIPIHLPALRERRTDVRQLAQHFVDGFAQRRGQSITGFSPEAMLLLGRHSWPGNVRELQNAVERMCLLHQGDGVLGLDDLPAKIRALARPGDAEEAASQAAEVQALADAATAAEPPPSAAATATAAEPQGATGGAAAGEVSATPAAFELPPEGIDLRGAVEQFEYNLIAQALERTGGNKNQASRLLGMNRTTLVEKLRKRKAKAERLAKNTEAEAEAEVGASSPDSA